MKKGYFIFLIIIIIVLMAIALPQSTEQTKMREVVNSDNAKRLIENNIKYLDSKAFTDEGVVQSYIIDYSHIKRNPMGGIMFRIYINSTDYLYMRGRFGNENGNLVIESFSPCSELYDMLKNKYGESYR